MSGISTTEAIKRALERQMAWTPKYSIEYDEQQKEIVLKNEPETSGQESRVSMTPFLTDKYLDRAFIVQFENDNKKQYKLRLIWNDNHSADIDLSSLQDKYLAGTGIAITNDTISIDTTVTYLFDAGDASQYISE